MGNYPLSFGLWRRQILSFDGVRKARPRMGAIAEGLVGRLPAAAKPNRRPTCETKRLACRVDYFKIAFDANRAVVVDSDSRGCHSVILQISQSIYAHFAQTSLFHVVNVAVYLNVFGQKRMFAHAIHLRGNIAIEISKRMKLKV